MDKMPLATDQVEVVAVVSQFLEQAETVRKALL